MASGATALRAAVIALLRADGALAAIMGGSARVYDAPPERAALPFAAWEAETNDDGPDAVITMTLHAFSRAEGRKEVEAIGARIEALLDEQESAPQIVGFRIATMRKTFSDASPEENGNTYHGVTRFRVFLEEL